jgi:hypothetical protein
MKKILNLTLIIIAAAAVIAAIGRSMNTEETTMDTHYPMLVDTTEHLIAYDITDCRIDLACGQMPDTTQQNVILCAAAAFTGKCMDHLSTTISWDLIFLEACATMDTPRIKMGYPLRNAMHSLCGKARIIKEKN